MPRPVSILLAVFLGVLGFCGCSRRQAPAAPAPAASPAPAENALAAPVLAAVAAQLDLALDQVQWDVPIARQTKAGDDVDLQELLNRLNEELGHNGTLAMLRTAAGAADDQDLAGLITPELLADMLSKAPVRPPVPLPDPNAVIEIPAEPE